MFRSGYTFLVVATILFLAVGGVRAADVSNEPLSLYYDPAAENDVPGPPPNYHLLGSEYFVGGPDFNRLSIGDTGGYSVYFDSEKNRWVICSVVQAGGAFFEQLHGSVLVQLDREPVLGGNVWPLGFAVSDDLTKNDRWGWVKYPDDKGHNLYEIWWDITIDYARLENTTDFLDTIGIAFTSCACDFNIWATGHLSSFDADQLLLGRERIPISYIPEFDDTFVGIKDPYDDGTAAVTSNTSVFTPSPLPGASYDKDGLIVPGTEYGETFSGSYTYEGNGIQFSAYSCNSTHSPTFTPALGYTTYLTLCPGTTVYDTVTVTDADAEDIVTLTKLSGPGSFTSTPGVSPVYGYFEWTPEIDGGHTVVYKAVDSQGNETIDSLIYIIGSNQPPMAQDGDTAGFFCADFGTICYPVQAVDPEGDELSYELLGADKSMQVTLDPETGELCLLTYVTGVYVFDVVVSDGCAGDTATITFNIEANETPYVLFYDSTVYLCGLDTVCFDVTAYDPDIDDSLEITHIDGPGIFTQTGNGTGEHCFLPDDVDSARYVFHYQVTDDCRRDDLAVKCPKDSVVITVILDAKPSIACPEAPIPVNLCQPEQVCIPIAVEPTGTTVTVLESGAVYDKGDLCFTPTESGTYSFTLIAVGDCGNDTCVVTFDVTLGTAASIDCPVEPVIANLCEPDSVCVDLPIQPLDANVEVLEDGAVYADGKLCMYAEATDVYEYTVVAYGDCGNDTCVVIFDVTMGQPPQVSCPEPQTLHLCGPETVSAPVGVLPADARVTITPAAEFVDGYLIFDADAPGEYCFTVEAVNECGTTQCSFCYTVTFDAPPVVNVPDSSVFQCTLQEICLPFTSSDPDDNIAAIEVVGDMFAIESDRVCFTPLQSGVYDVIVVVTDECGLVTADTGQVTVTLNQAPQVSLDGEEDYFLCQPAVLCFPLSVYDVDGSIQSIVATEPAYFDIDLMEVCLLVDQPGEYAVEVTVTDDCGAATVVTKSIMAEFNSAPYMTAPPDTTVFACEPVEVCVGDFEYGDIDGNMTQVEFLPDLGEYKDGVYCFTPPEPGRYCFTVRVTDECGESAEDEFCITYETGQSVEITCPEPQVFNLCQPATVCADVTVNPVDANVRVLEPEASFENGRVCYFAEQTGVYTFTVVAEGPCNADTCEIILDVTLGTAASIDCPVEPVIANLCEPDSVCVDLPIQPLDANVEVLEDGAVYADGKLCMYAEATDVYEYTVVAYGDCGNDTCVVTFDVTLGTAASIDCPVEPIMANLCEPDSVCVDLPIQPLDANVTVLEGGARYVDGQLCMYADATGVYEYTVVAYGDCGNDTCVVSFDVTLGTAASIDCPVEPVIANLCEPDSVCVDLPVQPLDANVEVLEDGAVYADGKLCMYAEATDVYEYTVVAYGDCGNDTCVVTFDVTLGTSPELTCPSPEPVHLCGPDYISVPLGVVPPDAHIGIMPQAEYAEGLITFWAGTADEYCFEVVATTDCGADTCYFCVAVTFDAPPTVTVPDTTIALCQIEEVCLPVDVVDPDDNIMSVGVEPSQYEIVDGAICFVPPAAGIYEFIIKAIDECQAEDVDTAVVTIMLNEGPIVTVGDTTVFACEVADVCVPVTFSDPDGVIDSVRVSPEPAYFDEPNLRICLPEAMPGEYELVVTVYDDCGLSAEDTSYIVITRNGPPELTVGDFPAAFCEFVEICIPVSVVDADDNLVDVTSSTTCGGDPVYDSDAGTVCLTPTQYGPCTLTFIAIDECGAADTVIREVEFTELPSPNPQCLPDTTVFVCRPGMICIEFGDIIPGTHVRILPETFIYYPEQRQICYQALGDRVDTITVIDSTACGIDSCSFVVTVDMNMPPLVIGEAPQQEIFCDVLNLCIELSISDPDNNIESVELTGDCPGAVYNALKDIVCIDIDEEMHCTINVIATDSCGLADTLHLPINAIPNRPPVIHPPTVQTVVRCVTETAEVVITDICVSDPDYDEISMVLDSGSGEFTFDRIMACGTLTFMPPHNDSAEYCFRFRATDECDTTYETICIRVIPTAVCGTCVDVYVEGPPKCVNNGALTSVTIRVETEDNIAAYDMLLAYDASTLNFIQATIGPAINEWEYFTYRFGADGNCEGACPSGLLRVVSIADVNNGPYHPSPEQYLPDGIIASLSFRVTPDLNIGGMRIPISFFWFDCGDNTYSDETGQYLYIDKMVFGREGNVLWDETDDAGYPDDNRPPNTGAPDECVEGFKEPPVRCIDFHNGEICIVHPDSIDARGDINLNGIPNEIADAVVYTNFFIVGLSAFHINPPGQIAASDVNGDGVPLTIADLVHLVRIITGDVSPLAKLTTDEQMVSLSCTKIGTHATVSVDTEWPLGAALLVFDADREQAVTVTAGDVAAGMDIKYGWIDGRLQVLIYSLTAGRMVASGAADLLSIELAEAGRLELVSADLADYYAGTLVPLITSKALPVQLSLSQNYPNPFNPRTTFVMSLPVASDYTVTIYNVMGQCIRTWSGYGEAGEHVFDWNGADDNGHQVASGMYMYRATAAGSEAIRKMILLK